MTRKLKLNQLDVSSFVTGTEAVKGGATCDCSLPSGDICEITCSVDPAFCFKTTLLC